MKYQAKKDNQIVVTFREYPGIINAIKKFGKKHDMTVSQIIRRGIRMYLLNGEKGSLVIKKEKS